MKGRTVVIIVLAAVGGLGVLTLGCCGGLLFWGYKNADANVSPKIDALFDAIDDGTFADTYETDTTKAFQSGTTKQQYADIGNVVKTRLGPLQSKSVQAYNVRQMNASSYIDATYAGVFEKGAGDIHVRLVREGGVWKVESFRVTSPLFAQDLATATCPYCGAPHAKAARFCPACGKALVGDESNSSEK